MGKPKKNERMNAVWIACFVACFLFAYGFSNQNALFQWKLPLALVLATGIWALLPRLRKPRESA